MENNDEKKTLKAIENLSKSVQALLEEHGRVMATHRERLRTPLIEE